MKFSSIKKKILIICPLVISLILFLNFFNLFSSPIQKVLWRTGGKVSIFFETLGEIKNLKKENEELKLEIKELLAENTSLKELKKENEFLRKALNIGLEKEFKLTLAQVIGKDIPEDSLVINKGSRDGVSKNQPVITEQKTLVGKIFEVYKNFSKVMLISNKKSSFDGKISETDIPGLVRGKGNFRVIFDLAPYDKEIKEGDFVITTALGGIFPAGILVGEIKEVKKSDIEPFQSAEIKLSFDIKNLEFLFVIQK